MIKVAICQMGASGTAPENIQKIIRMTEHAVEESKNLDVVCFPEYCYFEPDQQSAIQIPEPIPGPYTNAMCSLAKRLHVNLIPGSLMTCADSGKYYNSSVFINRDGEIIARYDKIHLMKALGCDESESVEYGDTPAVFDTDFGRVGLMVCYDLRFPELARGMVQDGADILFVPSMFPAGEALPPRTDHWDSLVESTALLNLTYTVAVNQYGYVANSVPFGRSRVVDPWGTVIAQCSNREDIAYAHIDLDYQKKVRCGVASWENRRPEVYTLR
mgnify:CR=1 FL=1